ncbi:MAG: hypothetical protein Q8Q39_06040 [bacterium]|nr:hypothetical protein [bacterium]
MMIVFQKNKNRQRHCHANHSVTPSLRNLFGIKKNGFTFIELMVTIGIAVAVSSLIIASYRRIGTVGSLERSATRIAQDIRSAQALALAADPVRSGGAPPCGFGVHAPDPAGGGPDSYIIYAKFASATTVPCASITHKEWTGQAECFNASLAPTACPSAYRVTTSTVRRFVLPEVKQVKFSSTQFDDIFFLPPDPKVYIMQPNPGNSASTVLETAGLVTQSYAIEARDDSTKTRIVQVGTSGRVEIVGGTILSKPCVPLTCSSFSPPYECGVWSDGCGGTGSLVCGSGGLCSTGGDICCLTGGCGNPPDGPVEQGRCYPDIPAAPSALWTDSIDGAYRIDVHWTDNAVNEEFFDIVRCAGYSCDPTAGAPIVTLGIGATFYSDTTGLGPETWYTYAVRARNSTGPSVWTDWTDTNAVGLTVPQEAWGTFPITDAYRWAFRLKVRWDDDGICNNTSAGPPDAHCWFRLKRCIGTGCTPSVTVLDNWPYPSQTQRPGSPACDTNRAISAPLDYTNCNTNGGLLADPIPPNLHVNTADNGFLYPNTTYGYQIYSVNAGGASVPTAIVYGTTRDIAPLTPTLNAPSAVSASQIDLTWTDSPDLGYAEETAFLIYYCTGSGCNPEAGSIVTISDGDAVSLSHTGLGGDTIYRYCIKARNTNAPVGQQDSACSTPAQEAATRIGPATNLLHSEISSGAGASAQSTVTLTWNNPVPNTSQTQVKIYRGSGSCASLSLIQTLSGTPVTTNDTVQPNTTYCYEVRAANPGGESLGPNPQATLTTPNVAPLAPTLISVSVPATFTDRADLAWTDNAGGFAWGNETEFRIRRCSGSGTCDPSPVGNELSSITLPANPPGPTTYTNTGLTPDTTYGYCLLAKNAVGYSPCSNTRYVTTFAGAPSNLQVVSRASTKTDFATGAYTASIGLQWTNPTPATNVTLVKIERASWGGASCGAYAQIGTVAVNPPLPNTSGAQSYTDTQANSLKPNTSYCYRIRVANTSGDSSYSAELTPAQLNGGPFPPTTIDVAPNTPTGLLAAASSATQVNLSWIQNDTASPLGAWGNETSFRIRRCTSNPCTPVEISSVGTDVTTFNDTTVEGTIYGYCILARNILGDSPCTATVYLTTPPNAPTLVSAVATGKTSANITWDDNSTGETNTYIERAGSSCSGFTPITGGTIAGTSTNDPPASIADTSLSAEQIYCYRVRATNAGGSANSASTLTVQTELNEPATFTLAPGTGNKINLAWANSSNMETGYAIEWYCTGDANCPASFTALITAAADSTTHQHSVPGNIRNNSVLFYRIRSVGAFNNSIWKIPTPSSIIK